MSVVIVTSEIQVKYFLDNRVPTLFVETGSVSVAGFHQSIRYDHSYKLVQESTSWRKWTNGGLFLILAKYEETLALAF